MIALTTALAVWGPSAAEADPSPAALDAAQSAYEAGQFAEAGRLWTGPAEAGDPMAEMGMATLYDLGQGVQRDAASAYRWYRRAADAGRPDAEFNVAVMLDTADGVPHDPAVAALWYSRAAARGNQRAQYNLGQLYEAGDGVPRNLDAATSWFQAASSSIPAAADRLAKLRHAPPYPRGGQRSPAAVQLAAPQNGATLGVAGAVELVWVPPEPRLPVRYFVQVMVLPNAAPAREVYAAYVGETATLAAFDAQPGHYAWRVYSVVRVSRSYAASDWARFEVMPNPAAANN